MINVNLLREKVISAAVLGKLSANYISKTSAKDDLLKLGIKIDDLSDENIPCAIKTGWEWVRVSNLGADKYAFADGPFGSNLKREHYTDEKQVRIIQLSNVGERGWKNENEKYTTYEHLETIKRSEVFPGNIVIAKMMPAGRAIIVPDVSDAYVLSSDCVRFVPNSGLNTQYLCYAINSKMFRTQVLQDVHGIGRERTSLSKLKSYLLPIPPIEEQQIIVDRIDYIFDLISKIDALQQQYEFDREILKGKIIDAGIRGRLTEQLPEDANAEDLYAQIQEEKAKLTKEGKIKKEKPSPEISDDEIPFAIPKTWKWVYMGDIFDHNTGKALNNADTTGVPLQYITTSNMYWNHFELDGLKTMYFKDSEVEKCTIHKGDLLICEGGDIGRSAIWDYDYEMRIQNHIHKLRGYGKIEHKYYYYLMWIYKESGMIDGRGIGLQGFSSKRVHSLIVPLPPIEEQKRIVKKLDELLETTECK